MRFRLFRSRAFWFGVPGLVFLLWAWRISHSHYTNFGFAGNGGGLVGQLDGEAVILWESTGFAPSTSAKLGHYSLAPDQMRATKRDLGTARSRWDRWLFVPHWFLLVAYLQVWVGLLIWRTWRYRPLPAGTGVE